MKPPGQDELTDDEEKRLRSAALKNAHTILLARQRAEDELLRTKEALERRTEQLHEETRLLDLLHRAGRAIASTLDLQTLLQAVTDAATELSSAKFGAFFYNVTTPEGGAYQLFTLSGAPREAFERFGMPRATPIFAPTFQGEAPVRSDDITKDPRYGQWGPHHGMPEGHLPVRSYLAVPVAMRSGEVIGGLFLGHQEAGVFGERTERLIVGLAAYAAVAVENARLYDQAKRAAAERETLLDAERSARLELERANLMKDEFLATLSHELRTPLNAVLGWSEMILQRAGDREDLRRGLETIVRNARAQAQLIEDLLDMNRILSGNVRLDVQQINLSAIVDAAVESVGPSAVAKGIRLRKLIDPRAGPMIGDPNRLQQVVWNLLSNAVKFTPKGGKIDVAVARVNSHLEITVSDSGIGLDPSFLPHLFERFRQADSSTTRRFGGLGLGLSIVKHLVELHGGTVRAESQGEGTGATFVVCLPLGPIRDPAGRQHPATPLPVPRGEEVVLAGVKILVVDDERDARELLQLLLEESQAVVSIAASADEALELLGSERPDIVVSDIGMPGKDGYQLVRELRALPPEQGGRTPAIALTAFARSEDRTRAMLAGYQVHLSKPIEILELVAAIATLLGRTGG